MIGNLTPIVKQDPVLTRIRGSFLLSRIANYYPDRFLAFTWLAIAYSPPSAQFSIDDINADSEEKLGYPVFGYWEFFNDPKTAALVDRNVSPRISLSKPTFPTVSKHVLPATFRSSPS